MMTALCALFLVLFGSIFPAWTHQNLRELGAHDRIDITQKVSAEDRKILKYSLQRTFDAENCGESKADYLAHLQVDRLSATGPLLYAVQAGDSCGCGATGNCDFWIVLVQGSRASVILEDSMVQRFAVEPNASTPYPEIATASHVSVTESTVTIFRFNGHRYIRQRCYELSYPNPPLSTAMSTTAVKCSDT
jgi:hypothetical protein